MKYLYLSFIAALFLSCGNETTNTEESVEETVEICTYNYDELSTKVNWTSFKFNEKTAVGGTFDEVNVLISNASEDMFKTLTGASFTIPTNSVNSNNEIRDPKIKSSFFGVMEATDVISGIVKSINETTANVEITMNGISKDYQGAVTVTGQTIAFATTIDMNDFEASYAIDSLNNVCSDLHKGADGISKLWTEVEINVETTLKKDCK